MLLAVVVVRGALICALLYARSGFRHPALQVQVLRLLSRAKMLERNWLRKCCRAES